MLMTASLLGFCVSSCPLGFDQQVQDPIAIEFGQTVWRTRSNERKNYE